MMKFLVFCLLLLPGIVHGQTCMWDYHCSRSYVGYGFIYGNYCCPNGTCCSYEEKIGVCRENSDCPRQLDNIDERYCCSDDRCCNFTKYTACSEHPDCPGDFYPPEAGFCCTDNRCCAYNKYVGICASLSDCPGNYDDADKEYCCRNGKCCTADQFIGKCSNDSDCPTPSDGWNEAYCCSDKTCCTYEETIRCQTNLDCPGKNDERDENYCCPGGKCCTYLEQTRSECRTDLDCGYLSGGFCRSGSCCPGITTLTIVGIAIICVEFLAIIGLVIGCVWLRYGEKQKRKKCTRESNKASVATTQNQAPSEHLAELERQDSMPRYPYTPPQEQYDDAENVHYEPFKGFTYQNRALPLPPRVT